MFYPSYTNKKENTFCSPPSSFCTGIVTNLQCVDFNEWYVSFSIAIANIWCECLKSEHFKWIWYRCEYKSCIEQLSDLRLIVPMNLCSDLECEIKTRLQIHIPSHRCLHTGEQRNRRAKNENFMNLWLESCAIVVCYSQIRILVVGVK